LTSCAVAPVASTASPAATVRLLGAPSAADEAGASVPVGSFWSQAGRPAAVKANSKAPASRSLGVCGWIVALNWYIEASPFW
jgi:hypothetical protein